ncbi:hypothetical protein HHK36_003041 [Tetracentron sinense]|uniref:GATA transcription factor n=1 Tax=Tetracentron sinense TaxID=13715 RepID=A0A834ZWW6_TETSI|nr:hypothetical protein HHK36_003041 [Tetracentron sinense]
MEFVEAEALKTSFRPEMAVKSIQHAFIDDGWWGNGQTGVSGDDSFVDELLDFSNGDVEEEFVEEEEQWKACDSVSSQEQAEKENSNSTTSSLNDDFGSVPASELSVPADDIENLEWLSHFVDDSFSEFSLPYPAKNPTEEAQILMENRSEPEPGMMLSKTPGFLTPVPAKARSKRSRTGTRVWSLGSPSLTESSSTSSSSSSSSSSSASCLIFPNAGQNPELFYYLGKPPVKKQKKKPVMEISGTQPQRRCSHCHVQKTPQWRTGPLGAKTLCNACGVRYKSGRLLPEYRPACSPTFSSDIHSNSHRRVLEMRQNKEIAHPESGLAPAVQSY